MDCITRRGSTYVDPRGRRITNAATIQRLDKIGMPPAYKNVCLSPDPDATLQGTGLDAAGRTQYRYSQKYQEQQHARKYQRLATFGRRLGSVRGTVKRLLKSPSVEDQKAGIVLRLLDSCSFRPGSLHYLKQNGTYGASTLEHRHFRVDRRGNVEIKFKGKAGVMNRCQLRDQVLATLLPTTLKGARRVTGVRLKDFRTFGANTHFLRTYRRLRGSPDTPPQRLKRIVKHVSSKLSNTPAICKKSYIHPSLLNAVLMNREVPAARQVLPGLSAVERDLVVFLEANP